MKNLPYFSQQSRTRPMRTFAQNWLRVKFKSANYSCHYEEAAEFAAAPLLLCPKFKIV